MQEVSKYNQIAWFSYFCMKSFMARKIHLVVSGYHLENSEEQQTHLHTSKHDDEQRVLSVVEVHN